MNQEYIAAGVKNEIAANSDAVAILASQAARLRALIKRQDFAELAVAQTNFDLALKNAIRANVDAAKARARVEALQRAAETPELLKSRTALNSAMVTFLRGR
jgi:hypothetical protein